MLIRNEMPVFSPPVVEAIQPPRGFSRPQSSTSSRTSSTSTQSTSGTSLLAKTSSSSLSAPKTPSNVVASHEELERITNETIVSAYHLVWEQKDYTQALVVLHKALKLQQSFLGKHHQDVGYTCNFIATAYWLQGEDLNSAMRYCLEARRIICKLLNKSTSSPAEESEHHVQSTESLLQGIDDRIHCILVTFRLPESDIQRAKQAIDRTISHELFGDRLKEQGCIEAAKEQYRHARRVAGVLRMLM